MKTYKGFNRDLTCRKMQYKIGETYTTNEAKACKTGFHACIDPLDCLSYYPPSSSVYCSVEQNGKYSFSHADSKVASTEITIGNQLDVDDLIQAHKKYLDENPSTKIIDKISTKDNTICITDWEETAVTGDCSFAQTDNFGNVVVGSCSVAKGGSNSNVTARDYSIARGGWYSTVVARANSFALTEVGGVAVTSTRGKSVAGDEGISITDLDGWAEAGYRGVAVGKERSEVKVGDVGVAVGGKDVVVGEDGVGVVRDKGGRAKGGMGATLIFIEMNEHGIVKNKKVITIDGKKYRWGEYYKMVDGQIVEDKGV